MTKSKGIMGAGFGPVFLVQCVGSKPAEADCSDKKIVFYAMSAWTFGLEDGSAGFFRGANPRLRAENGPWDLCGNYEKIFQGREIVLTFEATESKIPNVLYAESMWSGARRVPARAAILCMVFAQSVCGALVCGCIYSCST